jgi:hypothetical protein
MLSKEVLEAKNARKSPRSSQSPYVSPSDFFCFRFAKESLRGKSLSSSEDFIFEVTEILDSLRKDQLATVWRNWTERLK